MRGLVLVILYQAALAHAVLYDMYYGTPLTPQRKMYMEKRNATGQCTISVDPCRHDEGRRVDGTCVNPKFPSYGGTTTPLIRLLPHNYGPNNQVPRAASGAELPSPRLVHTKIISAGYRADSPFSLLASHIFTSTVVDVADIMYLDDYTAGINDCCKGNRPNNDNPACLAIAVPWDDPFLRRTPIRCIELTRFPTFQKRGCVPDNTVAERVNVQTPQQDLSVIYGFTSARATKVRLFEGGLLKYRMNNGVEYPPSQSDTCTFNRGDETACYEFGDEYDGNIVTGISRMSLWFFREHNRLARALARLNPCWDDQRLFDVARQINIAQWQYIVFYELLAELVGRDNALRAGVIYNTDGYVNDFDENVTPGVSHEYLIVARFFHTMQDTRDDLYNKHGMYLGTRTTIDDEFRSGILELNNTEAALTLGSFRQKSGQFDDVIDPDFINRPYGQQKFVSDLIAIDIMRGRDEGLQPYNAYRQLCGLPRATKFEDLLDHISPDKVEQLSRVYEDVNDIDLMAAIYAGNLLEGTFTTITLNCIILKTMLTWRKSDRHFFEHGDLPTALTLPQLREVRKTSIARILCNNGVDVDIVQPKALLAIGKGNELTSCQNIKKLDLMAWKDPECDHHHQQHKYTPEPFHHPQSSHHQQHRNHHQFPLTDYGRHHDIYKK